MMKTSQKEAKKEKYNNNNQPTNEWKTKQAKDVKREENLFNLLHPPPPKIKKKKRYNKTRKTEDMMMMLVSRDMTN